MSAETLPFMEDDHLLVSLLINMDETAWTYVVTDIITPLTHSDKMGIVSIFRRHSMPTDSIIGEVFLKLTKNDCAALKNFRYECRFSSYMYMRVYDAAQTVIRKKTGNIQYVLSDVPVGDTLIGSEESSKDLLVKDDVKQGTLFLAKLWKENPTYAFVLLLRHDLRLPSNDVGTLLGKTKANVDQINHRAQKRMNEYRKAHDENF